MDFQISQNSGTYSRKSRFRAPGNRPKPGFPDISKQRNVFAKVAISSSGKPAKIWISRYIKTGKIRRWGVANSESGESPKIRHFRTIKRWNLVRGAPISSSAEPAIPARKVRTGPDQPSRPGRPQSVEPGVRKRTIRSADRSGRPRRLNRGPSKCGNLLAEVAKTWIPMYLETGEFLRESRDFELRGTSQNMDFQISQNSGT